ncbi:MAG TPA: sugar nucleotide-binding protein [bacterium]|nr:sugar nucleotide-binding protein [bacterium]
MKILILGANGMAGHVVAHYFIEQGHEVTTFSQAPVSFGKNIVGDAFDSSFFRSLLTGDDFDAVINSIGLLIRESDAHPANAIYLNSYLPHFAVEVLRGKKTKFIQMSTDCVFAGNTGPYRENSFPDGRLFYDRTKALGEINDTKNLTFRNSIIGPDMNAQGVGLFNWFMRQKGEIRGFVGALWTGVTTITLAKAMEKAIQEDIAGIYNLVNNSNISKFELLSLFNKHLRNNEAMIIPDNTIALNKSLVNTRIDFSFNVPTYEEMVLELVAWIDTHKELYPHYWEIRRTHEK